MKKKKEKKYFENLCGKLKIVTIQYAASGFIEFSWDFKWKTRILHMLPQTMAQQQNCHNQFSFVLEFYSLFFSSFFCSSKTKFVFYLFFFLCFFFLKYGICRLCYTGRGIYFDCFQIGINTHTHTQHQIKKKILK